MDTDSAKVNLATFMRGKRVEADTKQPGPFLTISRQYGCGGYFLGLLLVDLLNTAGSDPTKAWRAYSREILDHLAGETDVAADMLDRLRRERPRLLVDFFRNLTSRKVPGGYEVRNRIANMVRGLAYEGHAIIIGMGGAGATADIENGLRIRLEAPTEWRVDRLVEAEGISLVKAKLVLQKRDKEREELGRLYDRKFRRTPPFDLVFDASTFTASQIAQQVVYAMKLRKML